MQFESFSFGSIQIDGATYEYDVVIDRGEIRKRSFDVINAGRELNQLVVTVPIGNTRALGLRGEQSCGDAGTWN